MTLNAGPATGVKRGNIGVGRDRAGHGTEGGRNLEYGANQLSIDFNDNNQITKITGVDQEGGWWRPPIPRSLL